MMKLENKVAWLREQLLGLENRKHSVLQELSVVFRTTRTRR